MSTPENPDMLWMPPLTATFVASIIYGITVLQTFHYYNHYSGDRVLWKILVGVIFVLDTGALGLIIYCMEYYTVLSWGQPAKLLIDVKGAPSEYFATTILTLLVQGFYINTVRALNAHWSVIVLLVSLSLVAFSAGLILPIVQIKLELLPTILVSKINHDAFNVARSSALACDVGIVAALCWLFARRKTGIRRANNMLNTLMVFAVQRGILQAAVQACEVLSYAIQPAGVLFLPFHIIVSRIYCTSLLATLNAREYVARKGDLVVHDHTSAVSPSEAARHVPRTGSLAVFTSHFDPPFLARSEPQQDERVTRFSQADFALSRLPAIQEGRDDRSLHGRHSSAKAHENGSQEIIELREKVSGAV